MDKAYLQSGTDLQHGWTRTESVIMITTMMILHGLTAVKHTTHCLIKKSRTHKRSPLAQGPVVAAIEGGFNSRRSLPVADELNQIVYTSKEEAMKHSKEKCG